MPEESTTRDSVERVESSFGAIRRGDFDAFMSFWDPGLAKERG
jgi:hypothetical protein